MSKGRSMEEAVVASLREGHGEFLRFVTKRTGSIADAEDILQDFYQKAIRSARPDREASISMTRCNTAD